MLARALRMVLRRLPTLLTRGRGLWVLSPGDATADTTARRERESWSTAVVVPDPSRGRGLWVLNPTTTAVNRQIGGKRIGKTRFSRSTGTTVTSPGGPPPRVSPLLVKSRSGGGG